LGQEQGRNDPPTLLDELWEGETEDQRREFKKLILQ